MLVVDASVAVKWFIDEPGAAEARALLARSDTLIAPELIMAEVINAVWKNLIGGKIEADQAKKVPDGLPELLAQLRPLTSLSARALEIATALKHPVYDCFYLALAEDDDLKLITADRRLLHRLADTPWASRLVGLWN